MWKTTWITLVIMVILGLLLLVASNWPFATGMTIIVAALFAGTWSIVHWFTASVFRIVDLDI